jgi:hypothetical protein
LDPTLGNDGPLGTFSAKIWLGYGLELYGPKTRHDLESHIRNAFAHTKKAITFESPAVENKCSGFHCTRTLSKRHNGRDLYIQAVCRLRALRKVD